jgi:hypothetical protein
VGPAAFAEAAVPTSYRIDPERRTVFTRATGVLRDEDLRILWKTIQNDPEMRVGLNELHDRTGVTACEVSTGFIWKFAESFQRFDADKRLRDTKVATVATKDVVYGLFQMNATLRDEAPAEFRVFRSMSEAREWLGLPTNGDDTDATWKQVGS